MLLLPSIYRWIFNSTQQVYIHKNMKDKEILDLEYFNTKNVLVDVLSDQQLWCSQYVRDKISTKMGDFTEKKVIGPYQE